MDISAVIGLILGMALLLMSIISSGGALYLYWDLASLIMVIGGSFAALMVGNPMPRIVNMLKLFGVIFFVKNWNEEKMIKTLVEFSEKARREGLLALEDDLEAVDDVFMRKGIQLVVDGTDPEVIKTILYTELTKLQERHEDGVKVFDDWGKFAPAFGMIGTLAGLIAMLGNLSDKSAIGSGMGLALITTMYGAIFANLALIPMKGKLQDRDKVETLSREIIIEGILSIQSGDNPRILEEKLLSYLPPARRDAVKAETNQE